MKITLIKSEKGFFIGHAMTVENEEDVKVLRQIRNINFWGEPIYNGRISNEGKDDAKTLSWVDKKYSRDGLDFQSKEYQDLQYIYEFIKSL